MLLSTRGLFPGWLGTRVITEGVTPSLHVDTSLQDQALPLGGALHIETTSNDAYQFRIGRGLHHLAALR